MKKRGDELVLEILGRVKAVPYLQANGFDKFVAIGNVLADDGLDSLENSLRGNLLLRVREPDDRFDGGELRPDRLVSLFPEGKPYHHSVHGTAGERYRRDDQIGIIRFDIGCIVRGEDLDYLDVKTVAQLLSEKLRRADATIAHHNHTWLGLLTFTPFERRADM